MKSATLPFGDQPITKLDFASIITYPCRLSNSDLRKLASIGYSGPADVAERLGDRSTNALLPLSVN